jgi:protein phosphatase
MSDEAAANSQDSAALSAQEREPTPSSRGGGPASSKHQPEIIVRLFGRTDVGQIREHNEDNFLVADLTKASRGLKDVERTQAVGACGTLLGVCDGMGGAAAGEVASQLAVDIIYQRMSASEGPTPNRDELAARLVSAIELAGARIFSEAKVDRTRRGMGTTATIAALLDDHLFLGQVGDSRGYILRGDRLVQVTRDQSLVNQLIEAGQLTEEEAETFEHNNIILQALGTADSVQVDLTFVELKRGDTLLLCSDGLSGMLRNETIRELLLGGDDPLELCKILTERANQAGGHDNITVIVAKFEGASLAEPTSEDISGLKYQKYHLPEPQNRADATQRAISLRPGANADPDISVEEEFVDDEAGAEGDADDAGWRASRDEPFEIPTDGAPSWVITTMIVGALTCVAVAGWFLLK